MKTNVISFRTRFTRRNHQKHSKPTKDNKHNNVMDQPFSIDTKSLSTVDVTFRFGQRFMGIPRAIFFFLFRAVL